MGLTKEHIRSILAPHYREACLQLDISMTSFASLMEALEAKFLSENPYSVWERLSLDKHTYDTPFYTQTLTNIEKQYYETLLKIKTVQINEAFEKSSLEGFALWEDTYLNGLVHWNGVLFISISEETFPFSEGQKGIVAYYRELNKYILNAHWQPAQHYFIKLGRKESLSAEVRANFLIYAGQIDLYHILPDFDQGKIYFDEAHSIYPHDNTHRALGEYYLKVQDLESAKSHFLTAIEMDPCDIENYLYLGDCYKEDGKDEVALQWYEDALQMNFLQTLPYRRKLLLSGFKKTLQKSDPESKDILDRTETLTFEHPYNTDKFEFLRDTGHAFSYAQNHEDSLIYYQRAHELFPEISSALIDLGYAYTQLQQYEKAKESFLQAGTLVEKHFDLYWGIAYLNEQLENWQAVIDNYKKCLDLRPSRKDLIYYNLGYSNAKAENFSDAISYFQQAYEIKPEHYYKVEDALLDILEEHGTENEVLAHLKKRVSLNPENPLIINDLGVFYSRKEDQEAAIPLFEKAVTLNPEEPVYLENLGLAYEGIANDEQALDCYQKALNVDPSNARYHNRLGYFHGSRDYYEEAIPYYEEAVKQDANNSTYINNLGNTLNRLQRYSEAISVLKKALIIDPEDLTTNNEIGVAYLEEKRYEEALPHLEKAASIEPSSWLHQENLGVWHQLQEQYEAAVEYYTKGIVLEPNAHSILNRVGIIHYTHGELNEAIEYYERALALQPENEIYKGNLELAISEKGDNDRELQL